MTLKDWNREDMMQRLEELRELILKEESNAHSWISDEEREAAIRNLEMDIKRLEETRKE